MPAGNPQVGETWHGPMGERVLVIETRGPIHGITDGFVRVRSGHQEFEMRQESFLGWLHLPTRDELALQQIAANAGRPRLRAYQSQLPEDFRIPANAPLTILGVDPGMALTGVALTNVAPPEPSQDYASESREEGFINLDLLKALDQASKGIPDLHLRHALSSHYYERLKLYQLDKAAHAATEAPTLWDRLERSD